MSGVHLVTELPAPLLQTLRSALAAGECIGVHNVGSWVGAQIAGALFPGTPQAWAWDATPAPATVYTCDLWSDLLLRNRHAGLPLPTWRLTGARTNDLSLAYVTRVDKVEATSDGVALTWVWRGPGPNLNRDADYRPYEPQPCAADLGSATDRRRYER